jgi:hypothetical protein
MRFLVAALVVMLGLGAEASAQNTCTGLCQQQVNSCPAGGPQTTSVSGIVYAPNGVDPLPNVLVYVPNAPVAAMTPGVQCPVVGAPASGQPLVGTTTAVDGSFTIQDMPVGTSIPLVIVSGKWRRQLVIPVVTACANTALPSSPGISTAFVRFPANQSEGDIPKIAIATGSVDAVECVLRKVGINDSEFTDPSGAGQINLFVGDGGPGSGGAKVTTSVPETTLMGNSTLLNTYDLLMLPCEGGEYIRSANALANIVAFANAGGRVYSTHFSYAWLYNNPPFSTAAKWAPNQASPSPDPGVATVNPAFSGSQELAQWLQLVGATTILGQMPISTLRKDLTAVVPPTEAWLNLNNTAAGNPVMQLVFDTPILPTGQTGNQCGRVLFNEYHVENAGAATGQAFPTECTAGSTTMTAQEKLLEYSLFELTNDGGSATLTPATQDFGSVALGFTSAVQTFTWTNNSTFTASVTLLTGSGDFNVVSNNCSGVLGGNSCQISVTFTPTALGARTGTLTAGSNGSTLTSALTGTGVPAMTLSPASLSFGSLDVGASLTQTVTLTNTAPGPLPVPALVVTGDYSASTAACGGTVAANSSCAVTITFTPTTTGTRAGTVAVATGGSGTPTTLTGNGIDFTLTDAPASGSVVAGSNQATVVTTTPLAGFANPLTMTCSATVPGSTCTFCPANTQSALCTSNVLFTPSAVATNNVVITTTAQYNVIGYTGSIGGAGWLSLVGVMTGLMLWIRRRSAGTLMRSGLTCLLLALALGAASIGMSGCSGLLPAKNSNYTVPGAYTYTITATDGFLSHSATYSLNVKAQ